MPGRRQLFALLTTMLLALCAGPAQGADAIRTNSRWYQPDYTKLQVAGNLGLLSLGVGYLLLDDHWQTELFYGYLPAALGGVDVHTLAWKNSVVPCNLRLSGDLVLSPLVIGLSVQIEVGGRSFFTSPDQYPSGYNAWPTALHFAPYFGMMLHKEHSLFADRIKGFSVYWELGTIDDYLEQWARSGYQVSFLEIWNLALGVVCFF
jgi:hypothetical protein